MATSPYDKMTPEKKTELAASELKHALTGPVVMINKAIEAGKHTDSINAEVFCNWQYLELLLARQYIIDNPPADLTPYTAAIAAGKAFYTDPEYTGPGWRRYARGASGATGA